MKIKKHIFWEIVLVLSSVLIFRGFWHLMDSIDKMNSIYFLAVSLIAGIFFAGLAFRKLTHAD